MKILVVVLTLLLSVGAMASVIDDLLGRGFDCSFKGKNATRCVGKVNSFSKRISIILPHSLKKVDHLSIHLHGWLLCSVTGCSVESCGKCMSEAENYDMDMSKIALENLYQDSSNSVLIVPESAHKDVTFKSFIGSTAKVDAFYVELKELLSFGSLAGGIDLTGHSGAGSVIRTIIVQAQNSSKSEFFSKIDDFALIDATYSSDYSWVTKWTSLNTDSKVAVYYVPSSATEAGALKLKGVKNVTLVLYSQRGSGSSLYDSAHFQILINNLAEIFNSQM